MTSGAQRRSGVSSGASLNFISPGEHNRATLSHALPGGTLVSQEGTRLCENLHVKREWRDGAQ